MSFFRLFQSSLMIALTIAGVSAKEPLKYSRIHRLCG